MIYFIQATVSGFIKIGYAIEPWNRIKQLQTGSSEPLTILKSIPGNKEREKEIQNFLIAHRIRGEWYKPDVEVLNFIRQLDEPEYEVIGVHAYAILRRDTEDSPTDHCPFCGARHIHGIGDGHRSAHCSSSETKEEIRAGNLIVKKSQGYIIRTRWKR